MGIHKHSSGVYPGRGLAQARMFHESPAPDRGYGRPSLRAVGSTSRKPGVLGCSFDRLPETTLGTGRTGSPCDVLFKYVSDPIPRYRGTVAWWPARLALLAWRAGTPISTVSRWRFVKHPGQRLKQAGINSHRTRRNS